jgi:hypothetical protein
MLLSFFWLKTTQELSNHKKHFRLCTNLGTVIDWLCHNLLFNFLFTGPIDFPVLQGLLSGSSSVHQYLVRPVLLLPSHAGSQTTTSATDACANSSFYTHFLTPTLSDYHLTIITFYHGQYVGQTYTRERVRCLHTCR